MGIIGGEIVVGGSGEITKAGTSYLSSGITVTSEIIAADVE